MFGTPLALGLVTLVHPIVRRSPAVELQGRVGLWLGVYLFFFQAEDGIRDATVTGVQTCALPIFGRGLEQVRGDLERLAHDPARCLVDGHAAHRQAATAVGAKAERGSFAGITVANLDRVVRDAQRIRGDLRKCRLVALTVGVAADKYLRGARA